MNLYRDVGRGTWDVGRYALAGVFLVLCFVRSADAASVTAEARVLKSKVKIGDEIRLLLKVDHPRKVQVLAPDAKTELKPFVIKSVESVPVKKGQNRVEETFRMTLTVFGTGDLKIPPIPVSYTDEQGVAGRILSNEVPVKVSGVGKKLTDKDDIRPIKGPAASDLTHFWTGVYSWSAGLLFVWLIIKIFLRRWRDRKNSESRKLPHERAKIELARLKDRGLLEEKNFREYYSGLSDILRRYFERRFQLEALEKTTTEIADAMKARSMDPEIIRRTGHILSESDLVKFAKVAPPYELSGKLESLILQIIDETKAEAVKK